MMTFYKSVHSLLGFSSTNISDHKFNQKLPPRCYGGSNTSLLGLVSATREIDHPPNVVVSSSVNCSKKVDDHREIGCFIDEDVDGLMSCTESLGFESSDERRVHNNCSHITSCSSSSSSSSLAFKWRSRRMERKREEKKFPPPISSLCENGQPSFLLRPMRTDGRLELTEVRIDRPSVFHACREDGRLRLHIVSDNVHEDVEEMEVEEEEEEVVVEEERVEWRFEGLSRCHRNPHGHYHHHPHHHNLLGEVS